MKRALFKLGETIHIDSRTRTDGFTMDFDVKTWAADDSTWDIPMKKVGASPSPAKAGTTIAVSDLSPEVALRLKDPTIVTRLSDSIGTTYSLFLSRFLTITLNATRVSPRLLPIGDSESLAPAFRELSQDGVEVELLAGLAARQNKEWNVDRAGWYVLCNGRVVVAADKTELTGWGVHGPQFVSKYRGFVGVAFFFSTQPTLLPWTTTKRGLNFESAVFQAARIEMTALARPVLTFLNNMYPSEAAEEVAERVLADALAPVGLSTLVNRPPATFQPTPSKNKKKTTVSVQYSAEKADVDRIRKKLNKPSSWPAGNVGRHTFDYFLQVECSE